MGYLYTVVIDQTQLDRFDLIDIRPAVSKPVKLHAIYQGPTGGSYGTADVGDTNEEYVAFQIIRGYTGAGSGGGSPTPQPVDPTHGVAASFGVTTVNPVATWASGGTPVQLHADGFNLRVPNPLVLVESAKYIVTSTQTSMVVRFPNRPGNPVASSWTVLLEEMGILNV